MPEYSQYIMDLGSIVCKAIQPTCHKCPVSDDCKSFNSGTVNLYPKKIKLALREKHIIWVLNMDKDRILLERQNKEELWKSLLTTQVDERKPSSKGFLKAIELKFQLRSDCKSLDSVFLFDMVNIGSIQSCKQNYDW